MISSDFDGTARRLSEQSDTSIAQIQALILETGWVSQALGARVIAERVVSRVVIEERARALEAAADALGLGVAIPGSLADRLGVAGGQDWLRDRADWERHKQARIA